MKPSNMWRLAEDYLELVSWTDGQMERWLGEKDRRQLCYTKRDEEVLFSRPVVSLTIMYMGFRS